MLNRTYFPGLNELRALAILSVIPGHIELIKSLFNVTPYHWFPIPGKLGVVLFFVLSGFLITVLLLREKFKTNSVNLKYFYIKRILRIWPLYFLIMGLSIFVLNRLDLFIMPNLSLAIYDQFTYTNITLLLLILPNYIGFVIPYAGQVWSLGIEEQFYFFQPFIVKIIKNSWILFLIMLGIVFLKELLSAINSLIDFRFLDILIQISVYFGCIAIGSIGAILCHSYPNFIYKVIHRKDTQVMSLMLLIASLIYIKISGKETIIDFRVHAIIFVIVIINASTNEDSFYNLKNNFLDYIGRISYGMYMYHAIAISLAITVAKLLENYFDSYIVLHISIYILTIIFTVALSIFSYKYYEGLFLSLKNKF
jgi:peptidoglycan/LPS O-acetylase OafA/YrhL